MVAHLKVRQNVQIPLKRKLIKLAQEKRLNLSGSITILKFESLNKNHVTIKTPGPDGSKWNSSNCLRKNISTVTQTFPEKAGILLKSFLRSAYPHY